MNVLCAVDTAIFKQEIDRVRLLELDVFSANSDSALDRPRLNARSNALLSLVIDTDRAALDQTREGTAWLVNQNITNSSNLG